MWGVDRLRGFAWLATVSVLPLAGCATTVVFAERRADSPAPGALRIATERGLEDVSTGEEVRIEIPIEVRSGESPVAVPGCAMQVFRATDAPGREILTEAVSEDAARLVVDTFGSDVSDLENSGPDVFVPPNSRQMVTVTLIADRSAVGAGMLGVRLDEQAVTLTRDEGCPGLDAREVSQVQDYALRIVEVETGGVGIAAGALMLLVIIGVTGG